MKKNILSKLCILALVIGVAGCKAKKPVGKPLITPNASPAASSFSKADALKKIGDKQVQYNTLLLKAKADLSINGNDNDVSMNIRMQKDKVIWVSVTAIAGIEVARALITPDSIKILNRLESSYTKKPFDYVYQFANKQVNFKTLQTILIGNALPGTLTESSTVTPMAGQIQVKGDLSGLAYLLLFAVNNTLIQSNLTDKAASQALSVNYSDYANFMNQAFPQSVNIKSSASNKNISIDLKYNYVGVNEKVDFPFSVPKRFTVKN